MEWEKQRIEGLVREIGFYGLVGVIRHILAAYYPKDLSLGNPDVGARFTQKLHEAIELLDEHERLRGEE